MQSIQSYKTKEGGVGDSSQINKSPDMPESLLTFDLHVFKAFHPGVVLLFFVLRCCFSVYMNLFN